MSWFDALILHWIDPYRDVLRDHQALFWWLGLSSVAVFLGSLLVTPWLICRIPADYFLTSGRAHTVFQHHPGLKWPVWIVRNIMGVLFVLAGVAMLVLPGQGALTVFVGLLLIDFPGKHSLVLRIVSQRRIAKALNWVRKRAGKPPLQISGSAVTGSEEPLSKQDSV